MGDLKFEYAKRVIYPWLNDDLSDDDSMLRQMSSEGWRVIKIIPENTDRESEYWSPRVFFFERESA